MFPWASNPSGYSVELLTLEGKRLAADIFRIERKATRMLASGMEPRAVAEFVSREFERISADFRIRLRGPRRSESYYSVTEVRETHR